MSQLYYNYYHVVTHCGKADKNNHNKSDSPSNLFLRLGFIRKMLLCIVAMQLDR